MDHFMPKPFFISTFKEVIRRTINNQKKAKAGTDSMVQTAMQRAMDRKHWKNLWILCLVHII